MANTVSESELLVEMRGVLDEIASSRLTSKQAYARLLQAMFDTKGLIGTPPMLTSIITRYNESFSADSSQRIPLGTASAVREAHGLFMRQLGSLNKGRLPLDSLSPGLGQKVANLFDEIVAEIGASIFEKAKTQFETQLANANAAFASASEAWTEERTGYLSEAEVFRTELQQSQIAASKAAERAASLLSQLDTLRRQLNVSETNEAVAKARLSDADNALSKSELKVAELTISEREERHVRLQLLDTSRQQALKVQALESELSASKEAIRTTNADLSMMRTMYEDAANQLTLLRKKTEASLPVVAPSRKRGVAKSAVRAGSIAMKMRRAKAGG